MSPYKNTTINPDWDPPEHSWACLHPGKKDIETKVTFSPGRSDTGDWFCAFNQGLFILTSFIYIIAIDQLIKISQTPNHGTSYTISRVHSETGKQGKQGKKVLVMEKSGESQGKRKNNKKSGKSQGKSFYCVFLIYF